MDLSTSAFVNLGVIPAEFAFGAVDPTTHVKLSRNGNPDFRWTGLRGGVRIPKSDPILKPEGKVLSGAVCVEVQQRTEAMKDRRPGARYRKVAEYDAVLVTVK